MFIILFTGSIQCKMKIIEFPEFTLIVVDDDIEEPNATIYPSPREHDSEWKPIPQRCIGVESDGFPSKTFRPPSLLIQHLILSGFRQV